MVWTENVLHKIDSVEVFYLNEQHSMFYMARKVITLKKGKENLFQGANIASKYKKVHF